METKAQLIAPAQLRLRLDGGALLANYRWFRDAAGVPAVPAVKADGYGLGAAEVARRLLNEGAPAVAVSSWAEAARLAGMPVLVLVLHGFTADCAEIAAALPGARPVLETASQCRQWASAFPGRPADLMVDTGMNRLGLALEELPAAADIPVDTVHSHLASADIPGSPQSERQLARFHAFVTETPHARHALANSAGICLGRRFSFDLVRPGLGLYGGVPHPDARVLPVVRPEARVIQVRTVEPGEAVGYGATWIATRTSRIAIVNLGYADGLPRLLGGAFSFDVDGARASLAGRISMDMTAIDVTGHDVAEGDWLTLDFDLPALSAAGGISQYELLVWMSSRYDRIWA